MKLLNAFSLNMLPHFQCTVKFEEITAKEAAGTLRREGAESCVGHASTAAVLASQLGVPVAFNRTTVELRVGEEFIVGQYSGPRLEEGAITLPEGAEIVFIKCTVV